MKPLHELTIPEAGRALRSGELTAVALAEHALARVEALDGQYHAFVTVKAERALADAALADDAFGRGIDRGPMQGIPYGLKDLVETAGIRTTAQSRLLLDNVPEADAEVARRLRAGGGVLLGKLATYEFAVVGPSFDLPFPSATNPWNAEHITGGSSSGSAAAVAGGLLRTAIGTDTGGSIRSPACYCGCVGLKPTYGRVSRRGVIPLSWSLDHVGPLSATVEEAAITLDVIAGHDADDPASADVPALRAAEALGRDPRGLKLAYARRFHADDPGVLPEIVAALDDAASQLSLLGVEIVEVDLPDYRLMEDCGAVILQAEAYAIHEANLRGRAGEYGRLAYQNLVTGFVLSAADLVQAQRMRRHITRTINETVFSRCDALLTANVLATAPRFADFDGKTPRWTAMRTLPFNVTGHPALALPIGLATDGLPMGMQLVGRAFDEATICQLGHAYERATDWSAARPAERVRKTG